MEITYDADKNNRNIEERGLPFDRVADFDFETALYVVDDRHEYGETRILSPSAIWKIVCMCCASLKLRTAFG
jgi:uncharacterized DUF497 family protein